MKFLLTKLGDLLCLLSRKSRLSKNDGLYIGLVTICTLVYFSPEMTGYMNGYAEYIQMSVLSLLIMSCASLVYVLSDSRVLGRICLAVMLLEFLAMFYCFLSVLHIGGVLHISGIEIQGVYHFFNSKINNIASIEAFVLLLYFLPRIVSYVRGSDIYSRIRDSLLPVCNRISADLRSMFRC